MAFQPIVDAQTRTVHAHEALVRGPNNESAPWVITQVDQDHKYAFDQACRIKAIELASKVGITSRLHINFLPNAVYSPENCIRVTLEAASKFNFPLSAITFEIVESEQIRDIGRVKSILSHYRSLGFLTALDDFGEGYSSLNLLSEISPDIVKLDLKLIRGVHQDRVRQAIVRALATMCSDLDITIMAEGVETHDESQTLIDFGIHLQQGYLFARPAFESLPTPGFP